MSGVGAMPGGAVGDDLDFFAPPPPFLSPPLPPHAWIKDSPPSLSPRGLPSPGYELERACAPWLNNMCTPLNSQTCSPLL